MKWSSFGLWPFEEWLKRVGGGIALKVKGEIEVVEREREAV